MILINQVARGLKLAQTLFGEQGQDALHGPQVDKQVSQRILVSDSLLVA